MQFGVDGLQPFVLRGLFACGRKHVVRPPARHPACPADLLRAESHRRVGLEAQAVARRRLEFRCVVGIDLRDVPEAAVRATAGVRHDVEVVVHLAVERHAPLLVRGVHVEVVGDVVERHRAAIYVDMLLVGLRPQLVARFVAGVLRDGRVVGIQVQIGRGRGGTRRNEIAHLAKVGQVERGRLIAQVEHPDGGMVERTDIFLEALLVGAART